MTKDKKILMLAIVLFTFLFMGNVKAVEEDIKICTPTQLSELRSMAANVKVTYVPTTVVGELGYADEEAGGVNTNVTRNYLDIKIFNLNSKLKVRVNNSQKEILVSAENIGADGAVTLRQTPLSYQVNYTFEIYSEEYGCLAETLRTIRLTLPRFNYYSQLLACEDIPDYYLCQPYTTFEVNGATFYDKVEEYKAKLLTLEQEKDKEEIDNTDLVSKAISSISKHKYIIVGVIVAVGVVLTVIILKRKKSV